MALSQRALTGLKAYKYVATGYTKLDEAHQPLWNWVVEKFPMWLAPNLVTLTGMLCVLVSYVLNIVYNPGFTGEAPAWVYWATALSVVAYVNLDCLDGKQARRTGSSSPLGQLFDHGVDALVLHMLLANIASSLGVGCSWKMAAGCLGIMAPWMFAQWEEYHTGIMVYGTAYYGVLEANYSICVVHVLTAVFGLRLWQARVPLPSLLLRALAGLGSAAQAHGGAAAAVLPTWLTAASAGRTASVADVALVVVSAAGVFQGLNNVARVFSSPRLDPKDAGYKQLGRLRATLHLGALCATLGLGAWSVAVAGQAPAHSHASGLAAWLPARVADAAECRLAHSMFGVLYALTATQLILAHMAKEPWGPSLVALVCPLLRVGNVVLSWPAGAPLDVLAGLHGGALVIYGHYVVSAINQICGFLGIQCLRIKPAKAGPSKH